MDCIFCKIINGEIPSEKVYEDEKFLIIKDISPQAKIHYLLLPKKHYTDIIDMSLNDSVLLGECLKKLSEIIDDLGLSNGFRLITNKGDDGCQSVKHLHIHIMGGEKLSEKMG